MKTCIIGAGAIGGFLGARLARIGCDVTALARGKTAAAMKTHGWRLDIDGKTVTAPVTVVEQTAGLAPQDLVVIAVKGPALAEVAASAAPLIGSDTMVLSAMNGVPWWFFHGFGDSLAGQRLKSVDPDGAIAALIPAEAVIGCVVHATCSVPEPGRVRHGFGDGLIIGEPAGGRGPRVERLAGLLARAGFGVTVSDRIQTDIWFKLWGNMTMNPVSALTGATCDVILDSAPVRRFCLAVMDEAARLGAQIGCPIGQSGEDRYDATRKLGAFKTSMLQDCEAGKPLEIDALLSAVKEIADTVRLPMPNLDALLGLVTLMARTRGLYPGAMPSTVGN